MASFYSRYVPPIKGTPQATNEDSAKQLISKKKRKHDNNLEAPDASPTKKKKGSWQEPSHKKEEKFGSINGISKNQPKKKDGPKEIKEVGSIHQDQIQKTKELRPEEKILAKYSVTKGTKRSNGQVVSRSNNKIHEDEDLNRSDHRQPKRTKDAPRLKSKGKIENQRNDGPNIESAASDKFHESSQSTKELVNQKYSGIRSKYESSRTRSQPIRNQQGENIQNDNPDTQGIDDNGAPAGEGTELHGLEPLPQPPSVEVPEELPSYSTLPKWLANPLRVPNSVKGTFESLGLDKRLVSNLREKGLVDMFPVQSAVIPLLLERSSHRESDICISAATGSGKTLAYVLPMVEALKDLADTKLRGLIVVPTRELVKQAREVFEICAQGTNLKIAAALGSKAIKEEQEVLIGSHMVYDPEQYRRNQGESIDWTKFGLEDLLQSKGDQKAAVNHVEKFFSKVDILICTPGRLVDHLRSTPGFNLDYVERLVIDEADKLLNESFQDWVEVVMPALKSTGAHHLRDQILRTMRLDIPLRIVQKVILSATMTQDLSKLNSLELKNPKLVVVGDLPTIQSTEEDMETSKSELPFRSGTGTFTLPSSLSESAVSVGDESEKPLYLLQLLKKYVLEQPRERFTPLRNAEVSKSNANTGISSSDSSDSDSSTESDSSTSGTSSSTTSEDASEFQAKAKGQTALIFTRSTESAGRLSRLLSLISPELAPQISTITKSSSSSSATRKTLTQFSQGRISLLIATDRASRGLDLPGLDHVISYDIPTSSTTYVHRVGRTARAGKAGHAWTLLAHREGRWFWNAIGKNEQPHSQLESDDARIERATGKVKKVALTFDDADPQTQVLRKRYADALKKLGEEVHGVRT